ncbi:cytochrome P450 [Dipodascopsis tothii]|uniref:cytochrome P450 n=1 Tax=Dipodascopsis tothii TaxID=44089 RepID=UPI0034CDED32
MGLLAELFEQAGSLPVSAGTLLWPGLPALFVLVVVFNALSQVLFKDPNQPPMVFHWVPWVGSAVTYGMDPYKFFNTNRERFGDVYQFMLLGRRVTVCLGPKGNDFVLNAKHSAVSAEDAYRHLTKPVFGEGVIYDCPNARLMEQKKFAKGALTTASFRQYVPIIGEEISKFLLSSSEFYNGDAARKTGRAKLHKCMAVLTIFTASRTLQGAEVREKFDGSFADLYHDLDRGFTPLHFVFPNIPIPATRRRDAAQKKIAKTYMDVIKARRQRGDYSSPDTINAYLKDGVYKDGVRMTDREISHLSIGLLMGGQHTSAATSTWALLHLAADPALAQAIYDEQVRVFGQPDGSLAELTYDGLLECKVLSNTIRETLRIHPPLHSLMRKVMSDLPIEGTRYVVPKGNFVLAAPGVPMIDEAYFADPYAYRPSRWDESKNIISMDTDDTAVVSKGAKSPYLPFGAGRHRCIGEQFAYVQLSTILATFVRTFKLKLADGAKTVPPPDYSSMVTLPGDPSDVLWERR